MGNPRPSHPNRLICLEEEGGKACIHDAFVHMTYVYDGYQYILTAPTNPSPPTPYPCFQPLFFLSSRIFQNIEPYRTSASSSSPSALSSNIHHIPPSNPPYTPVHHAESTATSFPIQRTQHPTTAVSLAPLNQSQRKRPTPNGSAAHRFPCIISNNSPRVNAPSWSPSYLANISSKCCGMNRPSGSYVPLSEPCYSYQHHPSFFRGKETHLSFVNTINIHPKPQIRNNRMRQPRRIREIHIDDQHRQYREEDVEA
jgi:hypothetical protein